MKSRKSLLFVVVCCISGYVSASDSSSFVPTRKKLVPARKKSVMEQQLPAVRKVERARRETLFGYMRDGIQLATIPEKTCLTGNTSHQRQSSSGKKFVSLPAVATREKTCLKEKTSFDMPSFAPLYKGVCHRLSPSGKQPISLLGRVLAEIPFHADQASKNQLCIDESD